MEEIFATPEVYYCEQPLFGSYFEPLNATSNIFTIILTLVFYNQLKKAGKVDTRFYVFFFLLFTFGFGSAAWHTWPTFFTWVLDVLPVTLFLVYLAYFLFTRILPTRQMGQVWFGVAMLWTVTMTFVFQQLFHLNGADTYVAELSFIVALGIYARMNNHPAARWVFALAGLFLLQLSFRQADRAFCDVLPTGTHFLWHVTGSFVVYLGLHIIYFSELAAYQPQSNKAA